MMSALFAVFGFSVVTAFLKKRNWALLSMIVGVALCAAMLYYHATSTLQINW